MTVEWVKRFEFSQSDRVGLLKALAGKPNIDAYLDSAQSIVETWRASIQMAAQRPTNEERRLAAQRIKKDADNLAARLRELPEWTSKQLSACLWEVDPHSFPVSSTVAAAAHLLTEIALAASKLDGLRSEPRKRQHAQARQMIRVLGAAYRQHFALDPGRSRNSAFGKVVSICLRGAGLSSADPQHLMSRARKV